jgi:hypothetical protein
VTCTRSYYVTNRSTRLIGITTDKVALNQMWRRNYIISASPLVRSDLMRKIMFDPAFHNMSEDYDAWVRCLTECGKTVNYSQPSLYYRRTGAVAMTANRRKKLAGRMMFFRKHRKIMPVHYQALFLSITFLKCIIPDVKYAFYSTIDSITGKKSR